MVGLVEADLDLAPAEVLERAEAEVRADHAEQILDDEALQEMPGVALDRHDAPRPGLERHVRVAALERAQLDDGLAVERAESPERLPDPVVLEQRRLAGAQAV